MKYLLVALMFLTGCTSSTNFGYCVGVTGKKDPTLRYEMDTGNVVVAVLFSETLVVPAIVVFDQLYCPIAKKEVQ